MALYYIESFYFWKPLMQSFVLHEHNVQFHTETTKQTQTMKFKQNSIICIALGRTRTDTSRDTSS